MSRTRARVLAVPLLAAVVAVVAACGGVQVTGVGSAQDGSSQGTAATATAADGTRQETTSRRHDVAIDRVEIDSDSGDLQVKAGADGSATVDQTLRWTGDAKPTVTESVDGTVLRVTARCPGRGTDRCEAAFVVTVPKAAAAKAELGAGELRVTGLAGDQDLTANAGGVTADGLTAGQVGARSRAGAVELTFAAAPRSVDAESTAGAVTVRVPGGPYAVSADTTAGSTDVDVPTDASAPSRITASSTAGDVTVTGA